MAQTQRVAGETYYELDGQLIEIKRQLRQPSGYPFNPEGLKRGLQRVIEGQFKVATEVWSYLVTVDNDQKFNDAILEESPLGWMNSNITEASFPSEKKGVVQTEIILLRFEDVMLTDEVDRELDARGMRPAEFRELLALGKQYPSMKHKHRVIALGSTVRLVEKGYLGLEQVPCLMGIRGELGLEIFGQIGRWDTETYFAAVYKEVRNAS